MHGRVAWIDTERLGNLGVEQVFASGVMKALFEGFIPSNVVFSGGKDVYVIVRDVVADRLPGGWFGGFQSMNVLESEAYCVWWWGKAREISPSIAGRG